MKNTTLVLLLCLCFTKTTAQFYQQYFDGADTLPQTSLLIELDTSATNIWQVGPPQKLIFHSAQTIPNALITDTILPYPPGVRSSFEFKVPVGDWFWGILALQWVQKLDMAPGQDGGLVEFSVDQGETWEGIFNNPFVYNLYGFNAVNMDTLPTGEIGFTGTDTTWRNIWLCYEYGWLQEQDTLSVRFTFVSDTLEQTAVHDGWMIDNLLAHPTIIHTVGETEQKEDLHAYPNPADERLYIEARKVNEFHIIEEMDLLDDRGRLVDQWRRVPTKFFLDTSRYGSGRYQLRIRTNLYSETLSVVIEH